MIVRVKLVATGPDGQHTGPSLAATEAVNNLPDGAGIEEELDAMITDIRGLTLELPDEVMAVCTAYMARCTELHLYLIRQNSRAANWVRTQQLAKVMDLLEFTFRAASRWVEIRRQDSELAR